MDGFASTSGCAVVAELSVDAALLEKVLQNRLSQEDALRFAGSAPECVAFTLLALQQRIASTLQTAGAHTPSSAVPPYAKENTTTVGAKSKSRRRKWGGQLGHARRTPEPLPEPDRVREHQLPRCPDCQGKLKRTGQTRRRRSENIPEDLQPVITEDVLHRDYCPRCRKRVEPKLPDVLPNCTLGNRTLVLSALLHFLQGLTISQVVDTFNFHLRMKVPPRRTGSDVAPPAARRRKWTNGRLTNGRLTNGRLTNGRLKSGNGNCFRDVWSVFTVRRKNFIRNEARCSKTSTTWRLSASKPDWRNSPASRGNIRMRIVFPNGWPNTETSC